MLVKAEYGMRGKTKRFRACLGQNEFQAIPVAGKAQYLVAVTGKALVGAFHIKQVFQGRRFRTASHAPAGEVERVERIVRGDETE